MKVDIPREVALKILYDINEKGAYSNISLNKHLEAQELREMDRAFITDLVYGTIKWRLTLDWVICQFSSTKMNKISPWIINILRLGVYQLLYTDRIPESAACNESVTLSKKYGHAAASRFVNGVLRNIARNKSEIKYPDRKREYERYLSVINSHPEWMVKTWVKRYGNEFTEQLLIANNQVPEFVVRVNTLKINRVQLLEIFKAEGITAEAGKLSEEAVVLKNPSSIAKLSSFKKGLFQVQDQSSMCTGVILDPQPGEWVVDVCSAPGGKATHLAQRMKDRGRVIARDVHPHKIRMIEQSAERLGMTCIETGIFDAGELDEKLIEKADRVLVDAPCSGLGIIRRKPDIKWSRNLEDSKEIIALQQKILETSSKYVKSGGVLVYSTCTIEPDENEGVVSAFLRKNPEFYPEDITPLLPEVLKTTTAKKGYIQLYPHLHGSDGFFIFKMRKR